MLCGQSWIQEEAAAALSASLGTCVLKGPSLKERRQTRGPSPRQVEVLLAKLSGIERPPYLDSGFRPANRAPGPLKKKLHAAGDEYAGEMKMMKGSSDPLHWRSAPPSTNPVHFMAAGRAQRKQLQIDNMVHCLGLLLARVEPGRVVTIVDFCSGSGHLGLAIAHRHRDVRVVLVEKNQWAAATAARRILDSGLQDRMRAVHCSLEDFEEDFDIGCGVHACGGLSDMIHLKCLHARAMYLLCPCCVGKIRHCDVEYPRSLKFRQLLSGAEYLALASIGDYGEWDFTSDVAVERRMCKSFIETDRNQAALEENYQTFLYQMIPRDCTTKSDMILGFPLERITTTKENL